MIPTIAVLAGFALMLLFPCMVAMGIGREIEEDEAAAAEEAEVHPWWTGATHTATWSAAQDVTDSRTHRVDAQMRIGRQPRA